MGEGTSGEPFSTAVVYRLVEEFLLIMLVYVLWLQ